MIYFRLRVVLLAIALFSFIPAASGQQLGSALESDRNVLGTIFDWDLGETGFQNRGMTEPQQLFQEPAP